MGRRLFPFAIVVALAAASSPAAGGSSSAAAPGQLAPVATNLPSISGVAQVGQQLTANPGTWSGPTGTYAYAWARCDSSGSSCLPISGANTGSFKPTTAEIGARLRVTVTSSNKNGSAVATSPATAAIVPLSTPAPGTSTTTTTTPTPSTTTTTTTTTTLPTSGPTVTSLTLVNADTDADIRTLASGDTLDLASLPTRNLNVRANVSTKTLSVRFAYDAFANFRTESAAPFALAGDLAGNYYAWIPGIGSHTIAATPFDAVSAGGTAGPVKSATFTVTDSSGGSGSITLPSSGGSVIFPGDFETGSFSQWPTVQCANYGTASSTEFTRGNAYVVSDLVGQGTRAARFDLPAAANKSACEIGKGAAHPIGSDDYYSLAVRLPSNWVEPGGWGMTIAQLGFQYPPVWGGPLQLIAHKDRIEVAAQGGSCVYGTGCTRSVHKDVIPVGSLSLGVWHQLIVHSHWATDSSGLTEVWWKTKGSSTWAKTAALGGGPTVEWAPNTAPVTPNLDKIGAYRGASPVPLSIWLDGFCRATSFAAAAGCL
jgi:hypothetical protein